MVMYLLLFLLCSFIAYNGWVVSAFTVSARSGRRLSSSKKNKVSDDVEVLSLMRLASAHLAPQALRCLVELGIPDILGNDKMTLNEISSKISSDNIQKDALCFE